MTAFDYVMGLLSIISSLGLVHLVSRFVALIRKGRKVRWALIPLLWMWNAFATTIGNWASYWSMHKVGDWPGWLIVLSVFVALLQYAFCVFVMPELDSDKPVDLASFHEHESKRYILAFMGLVGIAAAQNVATGIEGTYVFWLRDLELCSLGTLFSTIALMARPRWAQLVAAIALAAIASWILLTTTGISDAVG